MTTHFFDNWFAKTFLWKDYSAITIFVSFYKKHKSKVSERSINHESIHQRQQLECLILGTGLAIILGLLTSWSWWLLPIPFLFYYAWYILEYLIAFPFNWFVGDDAYYTISFEEETYVNDDNLKYLETRKWFSWMRYLGHMRYKNKVDK